MCKVKTRLGLAAVFAVALLLWTLPAQAAPRQVDTDPYSLIAAVNALRAANGLPPYAVSPILMATAQQHAEFMSVNGVSHTGYGGTRPFQRALNAGYPLAGDLSLGGFFSENITAGSDKSVQDAVTEWQGDAPHLNTMLSPNNQEIGAGVVIVDGYVYYVIDCARPTSGGGAVIAPTLPGGTPGVLPTFAPVAPLASTIFPATPLADGNLYHVVRPGETLWLIAITYGLRVAEIRQLNGMSETDAIYPSEKLLIRKTTGTLTPAAPQQTETPPLPTATLGPQPVSPTADLATLTVATPQAQTLAAGVKWNSNSLLALAGIVLAGVLLTLALLRR